MIALDASIVIALLENEDPHHEAAKAFLATSASESWIINVLTLAEVLVAPARVGRLQQAQSVLDLLNIHTDSLAADQAPELASLRAETGLKMPDACVLLTAVNRSASLATFDTKLAAAADRLGVALRL
ncbi:type II toxin-antitoxin system VapC family toxin [Paenarthrobacter sp. PH39-S1]|uniref:type II toxin-antitoxin system VapC family toxin n=1 Tax=Paenarthrobacter sp. PH39-S1 TaxID=3046204 RepID=UPI0024BAA2FF|nr:type II toxin-antitoxin system VapC family toxin [Paenarthrobacter sp. PH39-S1]MDJ0356269.1 type II toxin-antitoxin system VapC family toxin [Paenarthrobacter sp. PH39-S1]